MYQLDESTTEIMTIEVKVTRNQPESKSIRMQIPASMKEFLDIDAGDILEIELTLESGKHVAKVRKRK